MFSESKWSDWRTDDRAVFFAGIGHQKIMCILKFIKMVNQNNDKAKLNFVIVKCSVD